MRIGELPKLCARRYPGKTAKVEEALYAHPSVGECAVIGISDARWGEQVRAIVVVKPGEEADEKT
jgi:acyl-CoA synthetase (AMP-forming)/AMP-acid ligase II